MPLDHLILGAKVVSTVKTCPSVPIGIVVALLSEIAARISPALFQSWFNFNDPWPPRAMIKQKVPEFGAVVNWIVLV